MKVFRVDALVEKLIIVTLFSSSMGLVDVIL